MENKSTNDNSIKPSENKIICRKCGGPHFTIKCGKEKVQETKTEPKSNPINEVTETTETTKTDKKHMDRSDRTQHTDRFHHTDRSERKPYFKTTYRVKITDLPIDMTEEELMELTSDWGHIVRIKLLIYPESSTAYVDFGYEDEAQYFIKAIDKTPFEYVLISASMADSNYYKQNNQTNQAN